jgi:hypothetical protein
VTDLLAVTASDGIGVARLITLLGHVVGGATVAACTSSDVGALGESSQYGLDSSIRCVLTSLEK